MTTDIQQLRSGNQVAFKKLFDQSHVMVFHRVYKIVRSEQVAEDIVQDTFLKFWDRRTDLKEDGNPQALLSTIATRMAIDQYRKDKRQQTHTLEDDHWQQIPDSNKSEQDETQDLKSRMMQAIDALPPKRQIIFRLSKEENLTYKEIAEHLDISVKTVENQMSSALKQLRSALKVTSVVLLFLLQQLF